MIDRLLGEQHQTEATRRQAGLQVADFLRFIIAAAKVANDTTEKERLCRPEDALGYKVDGQWREVAEEEAAKECPAEGRFLCFVTSF